MTFLILNWKDIKNPQAGGAEIIAFEFARRLIKEGHQVTFFSRSFSDARNEEVIDGVKVIRRGNAVSVYFHAYLYYQRLPIKPDKVVDMVNTICWQTPLYVPLKRRIAYVNQLAKEVWFYEKKFPVSFLGYLLERFEYVTYKNTKIMCYSNSTRADLQTFGVPLKNISLFPMGLDHDRYTPGRKKAKEPLFIFVARLVRMKRADLCIRALRIVKKQFPHAKLYILGNGSDEARLNNLIKENQLSKNVSIINKNNFFVKKNPKDVKIQLMREAWVHLLLSVKEGWGMVVTEAAACGTPSIVSNVTGLKDSVVDEKTGLILSKNPSPEELARAMIRLIIDKTLRDKFSKSAIGWSKQFTWDKSYQGFRKILFSN